MNRIRLFVILGFAVAFAAGGSVGMLATSDRSRPAERPKETRRSLAKELALTPKQREQMRKIWSEVMGGENMRQLRQLRRALYHKRTEAIEALLTDEQREKYEQILADHDRETESIDKERERLIQEAVERTKAILTESQAKKYEEMRAARGRRRSSRRSHGSFGRGQRGGPRSQPSDRAPADEAPAPSPGSSDRPAEDQGPTRSEEVENPPLP